ncbi:hypothetical protein ACFYMO_04105 [Streptomyces sp. NPDC007025]|uniref:hypothetical protein n=1 Tax=Streptomyces sp. NPDC007025 TaxID=3364771 RepID=UPI0036A67909
MSCTIRLVGGPADGQSHIVSGEMPPPLYLVPTPWSVADLLSAPIEPTPPVTRAAEYEPQHEDGFLRRADDGAFLYRYRVPAVTPEQKDGLQRARAEVAEAQAAREAELDAAWQEIRKERPHYPKEWRDLGREEWRP